MNTFRNIEAVIFDWAGTLIDFGCLATIVSLIHVFKEKSINLDFFQARGPMGLSKIDHIRELICLPDIIDQWSYLHGTTPGEKEVEEIYACLKPTLVEQAPLFANSVPGARELLRDLRSMGILTGSTTGYVKPIMDAMMPVLREQDIVPYSVVCSDEVPAGRPAPFMIYQNAINMDTYPIWKMVKVGDTSADILEGLNAGMWTVGVTRSGIEVGLSPDEIDVLGSVNVGQKIDQAAIKLRNAGAHFIVQGIWDLLPILEIIEKQMEKGVLPGQYKP